eukprot:1533091-Rhodomonas_salina.2
MQRRRAEPQNSPRSLDDPFAPVPTAGLRPPMLAALPLPLAMPTAHWHPTGFYACERWHRC